MSRLGKLPVVIPDGVEVKKEGRSVVVKGPKSRLTQNVSEKINVEIKDKEVILSPVSEDGELKAEWGLYRVLINNMVTGVSTGFQRVLEIIGVGYKAELKGNDLNISVGYSKPVLFKAVEGVTYKTEGPTKIIIEGADKQKVGQVAANIRAIRPPEPYKGKGIRYQNEYVRRKAGKSAAK
ncbi:MAG: 50S ribosomal protein L6 [Chitinivibrionales bacterium]|nr:50S ribosomal protein L6 [Chitinivibrionales bacterium]